MSTSIEESQSKVDIAYLGPEGTFTESAVNLVTTVNGGNKVAMMSVMEVIDAVASGSSSYGVVPIENSVEGEVTSTLDYLIFNTESVFMQEEMVVPVTFNAFRRAEFDGQPMKMASSHPHALAQCRQFVQSNGLTIMNSTSTAAACQTVASSDDAGLVALGSPIAGDMYGLSVVSEGIEDNRNAKTRFILLSRDVYSGTVNAKTTFVISVPNTGVGILARCLTTFADRGISLMSISSRPLRSSLGTYAFVLNVQGHVSDSLMQSAVNELLDFGVALKFLGSYKQWLGEGVSAPFEHRPRGSVDLSTPSGDVHRMLSGHS